MSGPNNALALVEKLTGLSKDLTDVLQDPLFDSLAYTQHEQLLTKLRAADFSAATTVFMGAHLEHARPVSSGRRYVPLAADFLDAPPTDVPRGSVFLLLNNDIGKSLTRYIDFYRAHPQALFIVWDWDSQHWVQMSTLLAMNCDVYVPASSENAFLLSHFNPCVLGPVYVGAHQWTRRFLMDHFDLLMAPRAATPFGPHVHYAKYPKRNRAVASLARHFESVRFTDNRFKARTDEENLREWAGYQSHWIVPVLGGVPIRVYNALVTGGIPIVPAFYRNLPEVAVLGTSPLYYGVHDLIEPAAIHAAANRRFMSQDDGGLVQRITEALATQHVDSRCEQIFGLLRTTVQALLAGSAAPMAIAEP